MIVPIRLFRVLLAVLIVLAAGLSGIGLSGIVSAAPARAQTPPGPLAQVGGCIAAGGKGQVLIVVDTSGSLRQSDPRGVRVDAAEYLVRELSDFSRTTGADIEVATAGFSATYQQGLSWTGLGDGGVDDVVDSLQRYRGQADGIDTDYWAALDAARKALVARGAEAGTQTTCPVWFWFSDGAYDIDPRAGGDLSATGGPKPYAPDNQLSSEQEVRAALAAGRTDLCRAGGQADQLRAAGITTVAIGLRHAEADFADMRGVATGDPACGQQPARGEFHLADQLDGIFFAFDAFSTPGQDPLTNEGVVCGATPCAEGTHRFVLDGSILQARLLASSDVPGHQLQLSGPDGSPVAISAGDGGATLPGARLTWRWLSRQTVEISAERTADDQWSGVWSLVFLDPSASEPHGQSRTSLHLFGDLGPAWRDAAATLSRAPEQEFGFQLRRTGAGNEVVDAAQLPSTVSLTAELVTSDGTRVPIVAGLGKQDIAAPVTVDLSQAALGEARLELTLQITTASAVAPDGTRVEGTTLQPQAASYPVQVVPAPEYPQLPATVNFGSTEGADPVSADLAVDGEGCVWLGDPGSPATAPDGVSVQLSSTAGAAENCTGGPLRLTLTPSAAGNGLVSGTMQVMARPADASADAVAVPVRYQLEMARPANQPLRIAVFLLVLAAGIGLPLAGLYAIKWWGARMPAATVFAARRPFPEPDGRPLQLNDMASAVVTGSRRTLDLPGARLRTVTGLAPTEPGYVRAELGRPAASSVTPAQVGTDARLPLDLRNHWIVSIDPVTGSVDMLYLVSGPDRIAEVQAHARQHAPEVVQRLRNATGTANPPAGDRGGADQWDVTPGGGRQPGGPAAGRPPAQPDRRPADDDGW